MALPQLAVLRRSTAAEVQGVAIATWGAIGAATIAFTAYGLMRDTLIIVPGNVVCGALGVIVTVRLARLRGISVLPWLAMWAAVAACAAFGSSSLMGIVGTAFSLAQRHPQVLSSWRMRTSTGSGVSVHTWRLSLACNLMWLTYGLFAHDGVIAGSNALMALQCLSILLVERRAKKSRTTLAETVLVRLAD